MTALEALGGSAGCRRLAAAFYARVARDPALRPLFPGKSMTCAIEAFAAFLVQFLGGPAGDSQRRWWLSLRESHARFQIGEGERAAWMALMVEALDEVAIPEPARQELRRFFASSSAHLVEHPADAPELDPDTELGGRWRAQVRIDAAVAAIRGGDEARAVELIEASAAGGTVLCGLLAAMLRCGMDNYARARLSADPGLARQRYAGRTLLHEAAASGSLPMVEFLLSLGADANALDGGGHAPLYSLSNECAAAGGGAVARALVNGGADVNACGGVTRCGPLHMAARRGGVEIAAALLDCGARIDARDSRGDTPLQRARNCRQAAVAALLIARGARC